MIDENKVQQTSPKPLGPTRPGIVLGTKTPEAPKVPEKEMPREDQGFVSRDQIVDEHSHTPDLKKDFQQQEQGTKPLDPNRPQVSREKVLGTQASQASKTQAAKDAGQTDQKNDQQDVGQIRKSGYNTNINSQVLELFIEAHRRSPAALVAMLKTLTA